MNLLCIGPSVACLEAEMMLRLFQVKLSYKHIEGKHIRDLPENVTPIENLLEQKPGDMQKNCSSVSRNKTDDQSG